MKKYIVYKTTNLINNKIYIGVHLIDTSKSDTYIGCGVTSKKISNPRTAFHFAVLKYGYDNFKRETLFEFPFTEQGMQDAYKKEEELVNSKFLKRKDVYNRALGGKLTFLSRKRKIAQYTLSGKFLKIYESIQQAIDATGIKNIASAVCGIYQYSGNFQWKYYTGSQEDISAVEPKEKTVYQYDLQGNLLKVWKSATIASLNFSNPKAARVDIHNVCNNITKQAYGYYWSFKRKFEYNEYLKTKAVARYDDSGKFLESYSSLKEAAKAMNLKDSSAISNCIRGKSKHAKGFRWRFFYGNTQSISSL